MNRGFEVDSAYQGQEGVAKIRQALDEGRPYAMAFVDMRMPPGWDGLETIERLWGIDPDIQVVICSAHSDRDWTDVVSRLNNSDQLLVIKKPFEAVEVVQSANALTRKWQNERMVRRQVETLEQEVTARTSGLETANKQLRHLATHDALTGLPNRVLMDDRIGQCIALADRQNQTFAVIVLDVDRFKMVNDSFGHRVGDELLKEVALRLKGVVRDVRYGGPPGRETSSCSSSRRARRPMPPKTWRHGSSRSCRLPSASRASTFIPRPAWASRSTRGMRPRSRRCWRTPMRPCISPSRRAATISNASCHAWTPPRRKR